MRRLATVRRIAQVLPIEGADLIELAIVDGWQCVVKKGAFKEGQLVIYCEIDTVLPVLPQYEFLRKGCYVQKDWLPNREGFRLRTIKLRKQVSQGLLLELPEGQVLAEGDDVSDALGIIKWEPPIPVNLTGMAKGNFPTYIRKTDQERIQNVVGEVFSEYMRDVLWEVTLKLDGSSCTFYRKDDELGVCSRNINLKLEQEGNTFVDMFHQLDMGRKLLEHPNIAVQGELMGPGIQGNREGYQKPQFYVFDVWDIDKQRYLPKEFRDPIVKAMGLESVPVLSPGATLKELGCDTLEGMLKYADRPSMNHKVAEGVVFKALTVDVIDPVTRDAAAKVMAARAKLYKELAAHDSTSGTVTNSPEIIQANRVSKIFFTTSSGPYSFKCINTKYLLAEE